MSTSTTRSSATLLCALVLVAIALRGYRLGSSPMWVDEAESSLNALTIVADGVPGDRFLELPLFENVMVRPWPDSAEYEFRDVSYSDRGLAVYHSWLPLYSIAAAFRLAGVTPDAARRGTPVRDASVAELQYWSAVPRLPAVVFGALSVVAAWALGRRVAGEPAAIAMGLAFSISAFLVDAGRQARYYSALVAGSTLCGLAIWNAWRRGRAGDHALVGLAVGVLFHIHSVSAVAMSLVYVATWPLARARPRAWLRMPIAGGVAAVLILPWAAWSGLLGHTNWTPAARDHLSARMLFATLPGPAVWLTLAAGLIWLGLAWWPGSRIPERWRLAIRESTSGLYFGVVWTTLAFASFFGLMPVASVFQDRLSLMVVVPLLLIFSVLARALGRVLWPASRFAPAAAVGAILVAWSDVPLRLPLTTDAEATDYLGLVRSWELEPGGRIYATPNDHLVLTYYTGRPVQSIAPVRRTWLDRFPDDLVILEGPRYSRRLTSRQVEDAATRLGLALSPADTERRLREAVVLATHFDVQASGVAVTALARQPDALDHALVDVVRQSTRIAVQASLLDPEPTLSTWQDFRDQFFYRFSDPAARIGDGRNYRACRSRALATVLPNGVTVLDCRRVRDSPLVPGPAS